MTTTAQASAAPAPFQFDVSLLDILVCPLTKAALRYDPQAQELISDAAQLAYPVRDGIAILLVEEARKLEA